jgi:hypothetical protein
MYAYKPLFPYTLHKEHLEINCQMDKTFRGDSHGLFQGTIAEFAWKGLERNTVIPSLDSH